MGDVPFHERSGQIDGWIGRRVQEVNWALERWTAMLEPFVLLLIGGVVGIFLIAPRLPTLDPLKAL